MKWNRMLMAAVLGLAVSSAANADDVTGIRGDLVKSITDVQDKLVSLAKVTPEKKFMWRPAKGVRSIGEVYMHVAGGNYMFPSFNGVKPPDGMGPDMEKNSTDKAKVIDALEDSFKHIRRAIENTPEADLDKQIKAFGGDMSVRAMYVTAVTHQHEHLGQSIAYARMNGITPPWSMDTPKAGNKKTVEKKAADSK